MPRQPARLYILCGLPFAGKSTLARQLAPALGFAVVEMDAVNSERGLGLNRALITPEQWTTTYEVCYRRLGEALGHGRPVIFDAPSFTRAQRAALRELARRRGAAALVIHVDIPAATARERWLRNRETELRYDVRDEDFAHVVENFEAPGVDEAAVCYDGSIPVVEWVRRNLIP
jgi:predicted kinase